jgi:hypothetical protein
VKRGVVDVLRRGLDNMVANWPLLVVRLVETFLFAGIVIAAVVAIVVPVFVSVGLSVGSLLEMPTTLDGERLQELLPRLGAIAGYILLVALGVGLVLTAIHALVVAGCARVYADGEQHAGPAVLGPRRRYAMFTMQRWWAGATAGWWTVFWIYNLAWAAGSVILLIPLLPTLVLLLLLQGTPEAAVGIGCLGILVTVCLAVLVGVWVAMWSTRAIASWAQSSTGARASLAAAKKAVWADLGRHLLIALALVVVGIAGSSFLTSFSFLGTFSTIASRNHPLVGVIGLPIRLLGWLLSSAFSAAVGGWFLASYTSLEHEP